MGIFDIFSGGPAKDAAAQNAALYAQYGQQAKGAIDTGEAKATGQYGKAVSAYAPLSDLASKYGNLTNLYSNALGANGPGGNAAATSAFQASPGYQWNVDQALEQIMRKQGSLGGLQGGNTLAALTDRATNLANQEYGDWLDRLAGFVSPELSATGGAASGTSGAYQNLGNLYGTNALNQANILGNVASGTAQSNTAAANAQQQGNAAFWNALASLGGSAAKAFA